MAIISILFSGLAGFIGFLASWLVFDLGMTASIGIYFGVGAVLLLIVLGTALRRGATETGDNPAFRDWDLDAQFEMEEAEAARIQSRAHSHDINAA